MTEVRIVEKILPSLLKAPRAVLFLMALILVGGALAYRSLNVDLFPPLNFPVLNLITELPSFNSLEMERQVTLPLESAVGGVLGVTRVRSTSATGISEVSVEFQWGTDMLTARQLVIQAVASIQSQLPAGASPSIENLSATLSMIEGYALQGDVEPATLRDRALYELKPRLQRVPGVYKVVVMGGRVWEYAVFPNPFLLVKYDLTLSDLKTALADNNVLATPGTVNRYQQELVIHSNGQFANAHEIENVVVAVKSGTPVRIKDVARVSREYRYERGDTSEDGRPAVLINLYKQPTADTERVATQASDAIASFQKTLPSGYLIRNYYDQAQLVHDSIQSVKESVWVGALLVIAVLALFLNSFRSTLVAAMSIPLSVTLALISMKLAGQGLNIMSLGGLAIGTGIIVDDTIVVLENIFRWLSEEELRGNASASEVIVKATAEVARPVVVATLANIGIFLPMVFAQGFSGRLFAPVSFTVTFALLASLIMALFVIPVLANLWLSHRKLHAEGRIVHLIYSRPLSWALRHPRWTLVLVLAPVLASLFIFNRLDVQFLPDLDEGSVLLQTLMPPGISLPEAKRITGKIETWLINMPGVETVMRRNGHAPGSEDTDNVNHADILVKLVPKSRRPVPLERWIEAVSAQTSKLTSTQINFLMPLADKINDALGGVPSDLAVDLYGPDLDQLHRASSRLSTLLQRIPGITDVHPPNDLPVPSLEVKVDKAVAGQLGISEASIYEALQAFSIGVTATSVRDVQKEIGVIIHLAAPGANLDPESLRGIPIKTAGGSTVPLEQVAKLEFDSIPSEIYHERLLRKLTISTSIQGRNAADVARDVSHTVDSLHLPEGFGWSFSGKYQTEQTALNNMLLILGLAVVVVAFILWLEFHSMVQVGIILLTLPLGALGSIACLWLCRQTVNVSSLIGAVLLVGMAVRNGILLFDYLNAERKRGLPARIALQNAAQKRVRPILMTASVTILGLLPLAFGWGTGTELQRPLAIAVIGGLISSTLLTLLVIPAAAGIATKASSD